MSTQLTAWARTATIVAIALIVIAIGTPAIFGERPSGTVTALGATDSAPVKGITVQGTGRVTVSPDLATLSVGVQVQEATAAQAQSLASAAMNRIIGGVKRSGIADRDLTTQWISLQPQYDYTATSSTAPRLTGYQASQNLSVKVRRLDQAGGVIDAAVAAGATQVSGISFSVADPTAAAAQARSAAVSDARLHASALAQAAGVSLGSVISITEITSPTPTPIPYAAADLAAPRAQTPVQVGTSEVQVVVEVTFALGA